MQMYATGDVRVYHNELKELLLLQLCVKTEDLECSHWITLVRQPHVGTIGPMCLCVDFVFAAFRSVLLHNRFIFSPA